MSLLKISNIHKTYLDGTNTLKVLNDVSMSMDSNEIVLIMGPSGSGKTTLLNIVSMIEKASNGNLEIDGEIINHNEIALLPKLRSPSFLNWVENPFEVKQ